MFDFQLTPTLDTVRYVTPQLSFNLVERDFPGCIRKMVAETMEGNEREMETRSHCSFRKRILSRTIGALRLCNSAEPQVFCQHRKRKTELTVFAFNLYTRV